MVSSKKETVMENMENIKRWISEGATVESIADALGMSKQTLYKWVNLDDINAIKNSRQPAVEKLESTMFRTAVGYTKTVKKYMKLKHCEYENGKKSREWEEVEEYDEEVYFPPDTTAGIFLLKNWGGYMNEPKALEIRKKELELKEKQVEANTW